MYPCSQASVSWAVSLVDKVLSKMLRVKQGYFCGEMGGRNHSEVSCSCFGPRSIPYAQMPLFQWQACAHFSLTSPSLGFTVSIKPGQLASQPPALHRHRWLSSGLLSSALGLHLFYTFARFSAVAERNAYGFNLPRSSDVLLCYLLSEKEQMLGTSKIIIKWFLSQPPTLI